MKLSDIIHSLAQGVESKPSGIVRISPGPIEVKVSKSDYDGARVLEWLIENIPDTVPTQYVMDVLDSARWWATLLMSMPADGDDEEASE